MRYISDVILVRSKGEYIVYGHTLHLVETNRGHLVIFELFFNTAYHLYGNLECNNNDQSFFVNIAQFQTEGRGVFVQAFVFGIINLTPMHIIRKSTPSFAKVHKFCLNQA